MTYQIAGLDPGPFRPLFGMSDSELTDRGACRVTAASARGYPCRVSLEDAAAGEELILLHHVSHDVATPYRSAYAIYVRKDAKAASYTDTIPPVFHGRPLSLRGFDAGGMLKGALLALPGEADEKIRALLDNPEITTIHAHNAAPGCFAARIGRS